MYKRFFPIFLILLACSKSDSSSELDDNKDDITSNNALPTVMTEVAEPTGPVGARFTGDIVDEGGSEIIDFGFVYSTDPDPSLENFVAKDVVNGTSFLIFANSLKPRTKYYAKAYATNDFGTSYGKEMEFKTIDGETMFRAGYLDHHIAFHNPKDKLIYFLKFDTRELDETTNTKLIAYNYKKRKIQAEKELPSTSFFPNFHGSLGIYNQAYEFYYINGLKQLVIIDGLTLAQKEIWNLPNPHIEASGHPKKLNNHIFVGDQANLYLIARDSLSYNTYKSYADPLPQRNFGVWNDLENGEMVCVGYSGKIKSVSRFSIDGNKRLFYDRPRAVAGEGRRVVYTRDSIDFIVRSKYGTVIKKKEIMNDIGFTIQESHVPFKDVRFSPNGKSLYFLNYQEALRYSTNDMSAPESTIKFIVPEDDVLDFIFEDDNNIMVIDFAGRNRFNTKDSSVDISYYPLN